MLRSIRLGKCLVIPVKKYMHKFSGDTLVLATHNAGKKAELAPFFAPYVAKLLIAGELGLPAPAETATTFKENAAIKALATARSSGLPALADDSGLSVNALNGAPGVYAADWAERPDGSRDYRQAMQRVITEIGDNPDRNAFFSCTLALAWPDGHVEYAEGRITGTLCWPPRGEAGFGYDPFFIPEGYHQTFAELSGLIKNQLSHRARACEILLQRYF